MKYTGMDEIKCKQREIKKGNVYTHRLATNLSAIQDLKKEKIQNYVAFQRSTSST